MRSYGRRAVQALGASLLRFASASKMHARHERNVQTTGSCFTLFSGERPRLEGAISIAVRFLP